MVKNTTIAGLLVLAAAIVGIGSYTSNTAYGAEYITMNPYDMVERWDTMIDYLGDQDSAVYIDPLWVVDESNSLETIVTTDKNGNVVITTEPATEEEPQLSMSIERIGSDTYRLTVNGLMSPFTYNIIKHDEGYVVDERQHGGPQWLALREYDASAEGASGTAYLVPKYIILADGESDGEGYLSDSFRNCSASYYSKIYGHISTDPNKDSKMYWKAYNDVYGGWTKCLTAVNVKNVDLNWYNNPYEVFSNGVTKKGVAYFYTPNTGSQTSFQAKINYVN